MKQYDIGIDLGTTSIIIATEEQGVVFRQPTIGAVDTRTNTIIAVGDEALQMVGRAPAYIDLVRPLRDGVIQDHRMTNELIVRFVNEVCRSRIFKPRIAVCVPAQITGVEADAVVESVMGAGRAGSRCPGCRFADSRTPRLHGRGHRRRLHRHCRHQHGWPCKSRQRAGGRQRL